MGEDDVVVCSDFLPLLDPVSELGHRYGFQPSQPGFQSDLEARPDVPEAQPDQTRLGRSGRDWTPKEVRSNSGERQR
jgi:hypothetical protein